MSFRTHPSLASHVWMIQPRGGGLLGQGLSNRTVMLCNADDDDDGDAKKNKRHRKLIRGLGIRRWAETKQKVGWNTSINVAGGKEKNEK